MALFRVAVDVTTLWTSPQAPRPVDGPAVADLPDPSAWLAALDVHADDDESGAGRLGLHGRVDSQCVRGEPVVATGAATLTGWMPVVLPWQPSRLDPRGYPGWLRTSHLVAEPNPGAGPGLTAPTAIGSSDPVALARGYAGLPYLWGGMSPLGLDCSGLVHLVWRMLGVVVPRDADDQHAAAYPVERGSERPGDLYFFARPGAGVHHVGIVTAPGRMIHAPETGCGIVEEALGPAREDTLYAVGRLPYPAETAQATEAAEAGR